MARRLDHRQDLSQQELHHLREEQGEITSVVVVAHLSLICIHRRRGEVAVNQPGKADCTLPDCERKEYHINEPSGRRWRDGMAHNRWPTPGVR